MDDIIIHDTDRFPHAVRVESKGLNVLILRRLGTAVKNFSGQTCQWEIEYRWLSQMDDALCCVKGNEFTYYPMNEVDPNKSLFEQFDLF